MMNEQFINQLARNICEVGSETNGILPNRDILGVLVIDKSNGDDDAEIVSCYRNNRGRGSFRARGRGHYQPAAMRFRGRGSGGGGRGQRGFYRGRGGPRFNNVSYDNWGSPPYGPPPPALNTGLFGPNPPTERPFGPSTSVEQPYGHTPPSDGPYRHGPPTVTGAPYGHSPSNMAGNFGPAVNGSYGPNPSPTAGGSFVPAPTNQVGAFGPTSSNLVGPLPNLSQPPPNMPAPELWIETKSESGRPYYYHSRTRETTWARPQESPVCNVITHQQLEDMVNNGLLPPAMLAGVIDRGQPTNHLRPEPTNIHRPEPVVSHVVEVSAPSHAPAYVQQPSWNQDGYSRHVGRVSPKDLDETSLREGLPAQTQPANGYPSSTMGGCHVSWPPPLAAAPPPHLAATPQQSGTVLLPQVMMPSQQSVPMPTTLAAVSKLMKELKKIITRIPDELRAAAGEWTTHTVPDGRAYYYNWKRELYVWEKPKPLRDFEELEAKVKEEKAIYKVEKERLDKLEAELKLQEELNLQCAIKMQEEITKVEVIDVEEHDAEREAALEREREEKRILEELRREILKKEIEEKEREERERLEKERLEKELEKERLERERLEKEQKLKEEKEREERERLEKIKEQKKREEEEEREKAKREDSKNAGSKPTWSEHIVGTPWHVVWTCEGGVFFFNPCAAPSSVWARPACLIGRHDVDSLINNPPEPVRQKQKRLALANAAKLAEENAKNAEEITRKEQETSVKTELSPKNCEGTVKNEESIKIEEKVVLKTDKTIESGGSTSNKELPKRLVDCGSDTSDDEELIKKIKLDDSKKSKSPGMVTKEITVNADIPLEERFKAFRMMLCDVEVSALSTWERDREKIERDKRHLLLTSEQRRQVFAQFVREKIEEDKKDKALRQQVKKDAYLELLLEADLSSSSTFPDFVSKHSGDERFKAIDKPRNREAFFNEHVEHIAKHDEQKERVRLQVKQDFMALLRETAIDRHTKWPEARLQVETDPRYTCIDSMADKEEYYKEYCKIIKEERRREKEAKGGKKEKDRDKKEKKSKRSKEVEVSSTTVDSEEDDEDGEARALRAQAFMNDLRSSLRQLLVETRSITHRSYAAVRQNPGVLKNLHELLQHDSRYLALNHLPGEREHIIMTYLEELQKKGPPPLNTDTFNRLKHH